MFRPPGSPCQGAWALQRSSCRPRPQTRHLAGGCASTKPGSRARGRRPAARPARGDTTWRGGAVPPAEGARRCSPPTCLLLPQSRLLGSAVPAPWTGPWRGGVWGALYPCARGSWEGSEGAGTPGERRPCPAPPHPTLLRLLRTACVSWRHGRQGLPTPLRDPPWAAGRLPGIPRHLYLESFRSERDGAPGAAPGLHRDPSPSGRSDHLGANPPLPTG